MYISNNKKYSWFFIFIVSDLVLIYFKDSTCNFILSHLDSDYVIENFKLVFNEHLDCYNIKLGHMKLLHGRQHYF